MKQYGFFNDPEAFIKHVTELAKENKYDIKAALNNQIDTSIKDDIAHKNDTTHKVEIKTEPTPIVDPDTLKKIEEFENKIKENEKLIEICNKRIDLQRKFINFIKKIKH
jgi:predicted RND superfamily exporter protein